MRSIPLKVMLVLVATVLLVADLTGATLLARAEFNEGTMEPKSMSALTFGPEGILFIGDSVGAQIFALDTGDRTPAANMDPVAQEADLEGKIGAKLGIPAGDVLIHDMAVNPISQAIYLTVSRGRGEWNSPFLLPNDLGNASILLRMDKSGDFSEVKLNKARFSVVAVPNPVAAEKEHRWKKTKLRVDAVTDLAFHDNKLYVAGLSNEEFASTMRVFDFPFKKQNSATQLEIYHGAHGKWETNSPVRTFLPLEIEGKQHMLAAYLCTPLVSFTMDQFEDGKAVRGKTLAELGSRNQPLDMIAYTHKGKTKIILSNSNRTIMIFDPADIAAQKEGITTEVDHKAGVPYKDLSGVQVQQLADFNEKFVVLMQRLPGGKLGLYCYNKDWL
ncbi:hypothetical protein [Acanthopleuribacter pedis]|uniref:Uncharacterized protein n=1 Tax=Acanthopleuribacter pedis TaxID=442870 RepID=A0A8J7QBC1_9BACT|nr:hypothetical protein [Acanthopleuribacter pedis]MBO1320964.1 hypothetical protein [Acanthopleuribacter pedis]